VPDGDGSISIYSSNRISLFRASVKTRMTLNERVILSEEFCRQMLRLAERAKTWRISFDSEHVLFAADDTLLWSLLVSENPPDFERGMQRVPKDYASKAIPVPKGMGALLKRLNPNGSGTTALSIENGVGSFAARSEKSTVTEHLPLPGHPDVRVGFRACLLDAACTWAERFLATRDTIIMNAGPYYFVCAGLPRQEKEETDDVNA
jgi:hypothetical protein